MREFRFISQERYGAIWLSQLADSRNGTEKRQRLFIITIHYAKDYIYAEDPFIRRWGYVLFISRLCKGRAARLLPLMHDDEEYYVQMVQAWLIAELAVHEPETAHHWLRQNDLKYNINGKAIQKICDSFRITDEWKEEFKKFRPELRLRK